MSRKDKKKVGELLSRKSAPFFRRVGTLSRTQRILISLLTFSMIGGLFYYFFYQPRQEEMIRLKKEHQTLKTQLNTYKKKAAVLKKFQAKMADAQRRFDEAMLALPDKKEIPSLLTGISNAGSDAGLTFLLFKPESEKQTEYYAEIPVAIRVQGGFHQVAGFYDRVSRLNRIVNIRDISMTPAKDGSDLTTACKAVTYMFVEKTEKDNKGKKKGKKRK